MRSILAARVEAARAPAHRCGVVRWIQSPADRPPAVARPLLPGGAGDACQNSEPTSERDAPRRHEQGRPA
ncbi:MAG: hypothetical protein MZW92_04695 [Comamonadaceae bacterium]|nr:hypothetical protein [Comamonadaceae bacterium]